MKKPAAGIEQHAKTLVDFLMGEHSKRFRIRRPRINSIQVHLRMRTPENLQILQRALIERFGEISRKRGAKQFIQLPWGTISILSNDLIPVHKPPEVVINFNQYIGRYITAVLKAQKARELRNELANTKAHFSITVNTK